MSTDTLNPRYYLFPGHVETHHLTGHLTGLGGRAVELITRSSRIDGNNKARDVPGRITDLRKGIRCAELEIDRLDRAERAPIDNIQVQDVESALRNVTEVRKNRKPHAIPTRFDLDLNGPEYDALADAAALLGKPLDDFVAYTALAYASHLAAAHTHQATKAAE